MHATRLIALGATHVAPETIDVSLHLTFSIETRKEQSARVGATHATGAQDRIEL